MADNDNNPDQSKPSCGTCEHWLIDDLEQIDKGLCRRFPPTGFMVGRKDGPPGSAQPVRDHWSAE